MPHENPLTEATKRKGERSRAQLLEAALRIIGEAGINDVTHRRVAEEAGLTRGAVTYHFASRDEIILHAFRHYIGTVHKLIDEISADTNKQDVNGLIDAMVRYHTHEFHDPARVLAEYELILFAARNDEIGREVRAWEEDLIRGLSNQLEQAGAAAPRDTAHLLLAVFRGFELESLTTRDARPKDLRQRLRAVISDETR